MEGQVSIGAILDWVLRVLAPALLYFLWDMHKELEMLRLCVRKEIAELREHLARSYVPREDADNFRRDCHATWMDLYGQIGGLTRAVAKVEGAHINDNSGH